MCSQAANPLSAIIRRDSSSSVSPIRRQEALQSRCQVTMSYIGGFLDLNRDNRLGNRADDVVIEQQHCGGNTLVVYRGRLKPGGNYHLLPQYAKVALIPSIHCPMGSAHVGVQCPLTSSLFEIPGYWDRLRYPGLSPVLVSIALPFAFHISVFPFTLLHLPFVYFFTETVSEPSHQPSSFTWAWNQHMTTGLGHFPRDIFPGTFPRSKM